MYKYIFPFIVVSFVYLNTVAQEPVIKNINLYYKNKQALINYDLKDYKRSKKYHNIELFFVDDNFNVVIPKKISGDFGDSITAGINKQIQWTLFDDNINISRKLKPIVLADGLNKGGSANVIWSFFIPGMGDYFVENHRSMVFKPYIKTSLFFGCVILGYLAEQNRVPLVWKEWVQVYGVWTEVSYSYRDDYWLFPFDKELFLFTAASVWLYDLIWVYSKGNKNERIKVLTKYNPVVYRSKKITNVGLSINL